MNDENNTSNENASPNSHVKEFCIEYLTRIEKVDYAIWLKGPWGCGKTFLYQEIKERIMQKHRIREDDILYISLFGCSSIAEVQDKIFLNCLPFGENVAVKTIANIVGSVTFGIKGVLSIKPDDIDCGDLKESFGKKVFKRKILVFDDIERSDISPIELLGFFYNILDNDNVKLLLIGDEEEYGKKFSSENYMQENTEKSLKTSENESSSTTSQQSTSITNQKNKSLYHAMREKVVGYSLEVKPEKEVAIKKFVEDVKHKIDIDAIEKKLNSLVKDLEISNLRVVKRSLESFVHFYEKIDKQYLNKVDYKEDIFKYYMAIQMQYLLGDLYDKEKENYEEVFYRALMEVRYYNGNYKNLSDKKKEYDTFTYEIKKHLLIARDLWYELIINLNHKKDFINSIIKEDYNRKFAVHIPANTRERVMYYHKSMEGDKLKSSFEEWTKEFMEGKHLKECEIVEFIDVINYFARKELINDNEETECQSIIKNLLCTYKDDLLLENLDNDRPSTLFQTVPKSEENNKIISEIKNCFNEIRRKNIQEILNTEESLKSIIISGEFRHDIDPFPMMKFIDDNFLWQWLLKESIDMQWQVVRFLEERYQKVYINGNLPEKYYDDYENVNNLYLKYKEAYEKQEGSFNVKKLFYKKISEAYKELLDYMDKHINPQTTN